jgi:peptidoglycan/LPS O-acetylase OafA/YrhL
MTSATDRQRTAAPPLARRKSLNFRDDIQGLRAVAVGLVLLYHAGAPFLRGGFVGVDVFFVISGFLITGLLLAEIEKTGRISLTRFYARRAKRIFPAATVVLLVVAAITVLGLPRIRWTSIGEQIVGSAVSLVNWLLASEAVDYLTGDAPASPVQHFWTLAVEEQFYLVWPILMLAGVYTAARSRTRNRPGLTFEALGRQRRRALGWCVAVITVPSFVWSIHYTASDTGAAYFVTTTRLWELGIGAGVAIFAVHLARIPRRLGIWLGWMGLVAILAAGVLYVESTPFPGFAALLPTLGAAGVIVGGFSGRSTIGAGRVLALRPMTWVGNISYSLYLWHWPLIVLATYQLNGLSFPVGLAIVALSALPAYASYRYIEQPILKAPAFRMANGKILVAGALLVAASVLAGMGVALSPVPSVVASSPTSNGPVGAALLAIDPETGVATDTVAPFVPGALQASNDNPAIYADGCHLSETNSTVKQCVYGDRDGQFTVALVGDSHAAQWLPALTRVAVKYGWRIEAYTKSSCTLADVLTTISLTGSEPYDSCTDWNRNMMQALTGDEKPDVLVTSSFSHVAVIDGARQSKAQSIRAVGAGLHRSWSELADAGVPVVSIVDTPDMGIAIPECVSENSTKLLRCAVDRDTAMKGVGQIEKLGAHGLPSARLIALTSMICPEKLCAPVIGNVLVWRDAHHLTASYSRSLSVALGDAMTGFPPFQEVSTPEPTAQG